jgi:hypothetical protein
MIRTLILHLDDIGMGHGSVDAFAALAPDGSVTCGSVMVPCPWFPAAAALARGRPDLDLGVHLTLTSEWAGYRWGPVSTRDPATGLLDADGYLPRTVEELRARVDPAAAAAEMAAQVECALAAGIRPTHLDTHMGAAATPELVGAYLDLGRRFGLPALLPRDFASYAGPLGLPPLDPAVLADAGPQPDRFAITPPVDAADADRAWDEILDGLGPGVTFVSLHAAAGEMAAIDEHHAVWRANDLRVLAGRGLGRRAEAKGFAVRGYRWSRPVAQPAASATTGSGSSASRAATGASAGSPELPIA